jgi:hypothetical protein
MSFMRYQGMVYLFRSLVGSFCYDKGVQSGMTGVLCSGMAEEWLGKLIFVVWCGSGRKIPRKFREFVKKRLLLQTIH